MSITIEDDLSNDIKNDRSKRIASIDFVKGFAIMMIILCHIAGGWLDREWMFMFGTIYAALV